MSQNLIYLYRNIIAKKCPVNLTVLCDFIESLCAALVVHNAYMRRGTLHDVFLPHSMISKVLQARIWEYQEAIPSTMFTNSVISLLEPIFTEANNHGTETSFMFCSFRDDKHFC